MSIADIDIPIPSTASLLDVAYRRQTPDEVRVARAREAGQRIGPCPTCGWPATYEDVTIHRPGQPDAVRTLARCLRRRLGAQCPVETVAEALRPESPLGHPAGPLGALQPAGRVSGRLETQDALEGPPGPEEEHMPERTCATCGADIGARPPRARWCEKCANARKAARDRAWRARVGQKSVHGSAPQPSAVEPIGGSQNVQPDVPQLSLRAPVLDAGDDDESEVDFAALVVDVLGLSLNRRELLRALLEEVEVSA
jgi:hypothetical protein